jgi:hypothetical protein
MRLFLGILLALFGSSANAEAFKCITPAGGIIFSDLPCEDGEKFSKIRPSESTQDSEAARLELERQKVLADKAASENAAARRSTSGLANLPEESRSTPASSTELTFPGGTTSGSGSGTGQTAGVPRGVPPPYPRNKHAAVFLMLEAA